MKKYKPYIILNPSTKYHTIKPVKSLEDIIDCFWFSWTKYESEKESLVIPDNCVDLIFHFDAEDKLVSRDFVGIMSKTEKFLPKKGWKMFGIRFLPYMSKLFFKLAMNELLDLTVKFGDVINNNSILKTLNGIEKIPQNRMEIFEIEKMLMRHLDENGLKLNGTVREIVDYFIDGGINEKVSDISRKFFISESHLNRIFKKEIGLNVKTFIRINRFQKILRAADSKKNADYFDIALENGFFDQSHFIKEFKYFFNSTPSKIMIDFYNTKPSELDKIVSEGE